MIEHSYMTMKLVNGDTIICVMVSDDDDCFTVLYPIQMKSTRVEINEQSKEVMAGSPWCSFTDDYVYRIYKQDVIMLKPLNESTITYYKKMIDLSEVDQGVFEEEESEEELDNIPDNAIVVKGNNTIN